MIDEDTRKRALRKFVEEYAYDWSDDKYFARTPEIGMAKTRRLRALIAEVDNSTRPLTDQDISRLARKYFETEELVRTIIEVKDERNNSWSATQRDCISIRALAKRCKMSQPGLRKFIKREFPSFGRQVRHESRGGEYTTTVFSVDEAAKIQAAVERMKAAV